MMFSLSRSLGLTFGSPSNSPGPPQRAPFRHRSAQRLFVDDAAAGGVDDARAGLHQRQFRLADEARVPSVNVVWSEMKSDSRSNSSSETDFHTQSPPALLRDEGVMAEHSHFQASRPPRYLRTHLS